MKRLLTAAVLIPLITYIVLWSPSLAFAAVLTTVAALCFWEYCGIAAGHRIAVPRIPALVVGILILFSPAGIGFVLAALLAMLVAMREPDLRDSLPLAAATTLGIVYIFGCWRTAVDLRAIDPYWMLFALALNWIGDSAAMAIGRKFGRHKLAPRVSPGKSWEGSFASIIASVIFGVVYAQWAWPAAAIWLPIVAAIAGNIAGQVGDLCESALKRGAGMKDSGTLLPGHGGWLDRVDSSLFSMPVVYALLMLVTRYR